MRKHIEKACHHNEKPFILLLNLRDNTMTETNFCRPLSSHIEENRDFSGNEYLSGWRFMVVEDDVFNQLLTKEILESEGALVAIAGNGREAVKSLASGELPFDAVLMDLQMPVMDGYEATRKIRGIIGDTNLPIIAMTAGSLETSLQQCLDAGMNDYLPKPIVVKKLVEILNRCSQKKVSGDGNTNESDIKLFSIDNEELTGFQGLNVASTIVKLNGNRLLYSQIARMFCNKYKDIAKELESLLSSGDIATAGKLLHTFKGTVLSLGAFKVEDLTVLLEEALSDGIDDNYQRQLLNRLDDLVAEAIDSLRLIIDRYNP